MAHGCRSSAGRHSGRAQRTSARAVPWGRWPAAEAELGAGECAQLGRTFVEPADGDDIDPQARARQLRRQHPGDRDQGVAPPCQLGVVDRALRRADAAAGLHLDGDQ